MVVDENGNYDFSNDKTWGDAIWQSEANAIIENYSKCSVHILIRSLLFWEYEQTPKVVGAKRIGAVLSKADASALNGIMGQTHQMFNKMGMVIMSVRFRKNTMDNRGAPCSILMMPINRIRRCTHQFVCDMDNFHGDIWGGMALFYGIDGQEKHNLSAAYTSMKHGVNKGGRPCNELFGKEVWEPLGRRWPYYQWEYRWRVGTTGENFPSEKVAVLDYMERSLMRRV